MPVSVQDLEAVFDGLVGDILGHFKQYNIPDSVCKQLKKCLYHNTLGGKYTRSMSVIDTCSILLGGKLSSSQFQQAATLGWAIELLQASLLVNDDIMDGGKTRRGRTCWYLMPHVGMSAVNDACILESALYVLLKKHFGAHKNYVALVELFQETALQTQLGQACDTVVAPATVGLDEFTMERFLFIATFKTAYYSFYIPVAAALLLCDVATQRNLQMTKDVSIPLGEYYQVQNDYLDCYADPTVLGKIGTDIQEGKCTWLIVQALGKCSPEQRKVLEENYGRDGHENEVKKVYEDLQLAKLYWEYDERRAREIGDLIAGIDERSGLKKEIFGEFLSKVYKIGK
ncbi:Polyprenyl synthetase [Macrophomina phaseolina MS6]|uniref:Polyprenyl synthetase n=1 Tax=Macrophomina phaseolina (strain MS6) TaxID=1126212 RepID=K2RM78_MACPH|nr:Polyprenyl synthetase [Macrophomina phaseolina MS6]